MNTEEVEKYEKALKDFDWLFEYSDDGMVWARCNAQLKLLKAWQEKIDPDKTFWNKYERR